MAASGGIQQQQQTAEMISFRRLRIPQLGRSRPPNPLIIIATPLLLLLCPKIQGCAILRCRRHNPAETQRQSIVHLLNSGFGEKHHSRLYATCVLLRFIIKCIGNLFNKRVCGGGNSILPGSLTTSN